MSARIKQVTVYRDSVMLSCPVWMSQWACLFCCQILILLDVTDYCVSFQVYEIWTGD